MCRTTVCLGDGVPWHGHRRDVLGIEIHPFKQLFSMVFCSIYDVPGRTLSINGSVAWLREASMWFHIQQSPFNSVLLRNTSLSHLHCIRLSAETPILLPQAGQIPTSFFADDAPTFHAMASTTGITVNPAFVMCTHNDTSRTLKESCRFGDTCTEP